MYFYHDTYIRTRYPASSRTCYRARRRMVKQNHDQKSRQPQPFAVQVFRFGGDQWAHYWLAGWLARVLQTTKKRTRTKENILEQTGSLIAPKQ